MKANVRDNKNEVNNTLGSGGNHFRFSSFGREMSEVVSDGIIVVVAVVDGLDMASQVRFWIPFLAIGGMMDDAR